VSTPIYRACAHAVTDTDGDDIGRTMHRLPTRATRRSDTGAPSTASTTGYGSRRLGRATACASGLRYANARTLPRVPRSLLALPHLIAFLFAIPRTEIRLSRCPSGERIRAHLRQRRWGLPRFRLAQGVLHVPADFATYMRGRRRQAVRTNVSRARSRGIRCTHTHSCGGPFGPAEHWLARNRAGNLVGEAWVTVDERCALLHSLVTTESDVRWLLHTAIVERLCGRGCRQLLTNSHDAFLMPAGQQHFQHLLGYSVERVRPRRSPGQGSTRPRRIAYRVSSTRLRIPSFARTFAR
jgi:hypothetical protein